MNPFNFFVSGFTRFDRREFPGHQRVFQHFVNDGEPLRAFGMSKTHRMLHVFSIFDDACFPGQVNLLR
jgi:hypothetical protein